MKLARLVLMVSMIVAAPAFAESENGFPRTAFLFEARLGVGVGETQGFTALPSLLLGARLINRLQVGVGFSYFHISNTVGANGTGLNAVVFAPTFAVDIIKSHDDRAAFYGKAALPMGAIITTFPNAPDDTGFGVGFDFALGARYAFHRSFALGLEAGVSGAFAYPERQDAPAMVNVYGALVGSFYAGR
jgi:hypothetical protein